MKSIFIFITIVFLNSCGTKMSNDNSSSLESINGVYKITSIGIDNNIRINLKIGFNASENKIFGFSGCNQFSGTYKIEDKTIQISNLLSTKKNCDEYSNMIEAHVLGFLSSVNSISLVKNVLKLSSKNKVLIKAERLQSDVVSFEYSAMSRGYFNKVTVNEKTISIQNQPSGTIKNYDCSPENWNRLLKTIEDLNIKTIADIEPPSKAHQYDGAAIASLVIKTQDSTYQSKSFDHGNPPKKLDALVKAILSIAENIE